VKKLNHRAETQSATSIGIELVKADTDPDFDNTQYHADIIGMATKYANDGHYHQLSAMNHQP
jgi:hypothetical protein